MTELIPYLPILLKASALTLALAVFGLIIATILGGLGAFGKIAGGKYGREYAGSYTGIVRGIPDLVLLLLVYYGLQKILNSATEAIGLGVINISAFWAGCMAIGFIYGAYLAETFRGAYLSIPAGQNEAASALGLGRLARFYKVILPQLIRFALSGYGNVFQVLIKSTAVVGVIGLNDLVGIANDAGKTTREPFIFLSFVFVMYLLLYFVVGRIFAWAERKTALRGRA